MSKVLDGIESMHRRSEADRPSPAIPLFLLGCVVTGALVVALIRAGQVTVLGGDSSEFSLVDGPVPSRDRVRLLYWVIASVVAYLLALWIARRQGYRHGLWVDRRPLVVAGLVALAGAVIIVVGWFAPGDFLVGRGNVPLLAIAVGIVVWAIRERRPGLWVVAVVIVPLALLANFYNMENALFLFGVPVFENSGEIVNLGASAVALFAASAAFGLRHQQSHRTAHSRSAR